MHLFFFIPFARKHFQAAEMYTHHFKSVLWNAYVLKALPWHCFVNKGTLFIWSQKCRHMIVMGFTPLLDAMPFCAFCTSIPCLAVLYCIQATPEHARTCILCSFSQIKNSGNDTTGHGSDTHCVVCMLFSLSPSIYLSLSVRDLKLLELPGPILSIYFPASQSFLFSVLLHHCSYL